MKQLILLFTFLFFISIGSAQIKKRDTIKPKTVPVRTLPEKKTPDQKKAENKPVMVEKKPLMIQKKPAMIQKNPTEVVKIADDKDELRRKGFEYFKSKMVGSVTAPGGLRELKTQGNGFKTEDITNVTTTVPPHPHTNSQNQKQICATQKIDNTLSTDDFKSFTIYGPPDWLKPGIILKASSFLQGTELIEESYNRSPITLSITLNGQIRGNATVQNPKAKSEISDKVRSLVSQAGSVAGANMNFSYHEIHSEQELNFRMTGKFSSSFANIAAQLGVNSHSEKNVHYYLVEFQQTLFGIEVDGLDKENVFKDMPDVSTADYVYLSKVNYGRRGYFMYISHESLEDLTVNSTSSSSFAGFGQNVTANMNTLQKSKDIEIKAFYYGGSLGSASDNIVNTLKGTDKSLETYIRASDFSPAEAYPISYELKNLSNQKVGMSSRSIQGVETCVPVKDILKLKVTLAEIQCETTSDGADNPADYTVVQKVLYRAMGNPKVAVESRYNKFGGDCNPGGSTSQWPGSVALVCGSVNKQIHVYEKKIKNKTRTVSGNNINNYVVFHITPEEANDPNAKFEIKTYVRENNGGGNDIYMNSDPGTVEVAIKDVLATLSGARDFKKDGRYPYDESLYSSLRFDYFQSNGLKMPLAKVVGNNRALEGAIRARNKGSLTDKAFLWVRFELID